MSSHDPDPVERSEAIRYLLSLQMRNVFQGFYDLPNRMTPEQARLRISAIQHGKNLAAYQAEVEALSDEELFARVRAANELIIARQEAEEAKFHFNHPQAIADTAYWASWPTWKIDEGIALVLDRDPRVVKWEIVKPYVKVSTVAKKFSDLRDLAWRVCQSGLLQSENAPGQFLRWVERTKVVGIPPQLRSAVEAQGMELIDWQDVATKQSAVIDALKDQVKRIDQMASQIDQLRSERNTLVAQARDQAGPWPWGTHETQLLQELAAAANKWWKNYDPADPTTAPTNVQVRDWLLDRGVADRVAEIFAQALRPPGIPTGPRR